MNSHLYFKINTPSIIWEQIENEIIVINLENGFYYDVSGLSAPIWLMLENGLSYLEIVNRIAMHYSKPQNEVTADANFFLCTLEEEHLIIRMEQKEKTPSDYWVDILVKEYQRPELKKYTDMENLLLIDPIHEVDEHGWPNRYPLPQE